ncbi:MAG: response regulator [Rickettsiales bacterium]
MGILIVEDSAFQARILGELLKPVGSAVFVASTVKEAFEILQTVQISLIVSDLYMPKKEDGLHFIKRIKGSPSSEKTELFVCTIDDGTETKAELNALGVGRIFVKPYDGTEMLAAVREIFWCTDENELQPHSQLHH